MQWRLASKDDLRLLAELNHQLNADEGHRNPMNVDQLQDRMRVWLAAEYRAVLFQRQDDVVAYALFRDDERSALYLRQFFVVRSLRRQGLGRAAIRLLLAEVVPKDKRIVLDVLIENDAGRAVLARGWLPRIRCNA